MEKDYASHCPLQVGEFVPCQTCCGTGFKLLRACLGRMIVSLCDGFSVTWSIAAEFFIREVQVGL